MLETDPKSDVLLLDWKYREKRSISQKSQLYCTSMPIFMYLQYWMTSHFQKRHWVQNHQFKYDKDTRVFFSFQSLKITSLKWNSKRIHTSYRTHSVWEQDFRAAFQTHIYWLIKSPIYNSTNLKYIRLPFSNVHFNMYNLQYVLFI